jgi:hypothetical protein
VKFKDTPEEQKLAGQIVGAMREGYLDRVNQVPAYTDKDGVPVYRVLLFGLRWRSDGKGTGCYRAIDGLIGEGRIGKTTVRTYREWAIGKGPDGWGVVLHDDREGSPHIIAEGLKTMREARVTAEEKARRMPWIEGAPW